MSTRAYTALSPGSRGRTSVQITWTVSEFLYEEYWIGDTD